MSLTTRTSTAGTRRHFGRQHLVIAGGLIIAAISLAALALWEGEKAAPSADAGRGRIVLSPRPDDNVTDFIYYLVDTEEQAEQVRYWGWFEQTLLAGETARQVPSGPKRYVEIYVAPDAQILYAISEALIEIPMFGNGAQLIDWRSR